MGWGALYNPNISWEQCLSLADDPHQYFMTEYKKAKEQISNNEIKVRPSLFVKKTIAAEEEAEAKRKSYSLPELSTSFYNARTSVTAAAEQAALVEATRIGTEIDMTFALERETVSDTDLKSLRLMLSKANSNNNNSSPKSSN